MPLCDIKTLSKELQVGKTTLYRLTAEGTIPHVRVGGQLRFSLPEVTKALSNGNGHRAEAARAG